MVTPFDIYPPYTAKERDEIERMADPRMNWPSKQEADADAADAVAQGGSMRDAMTGIRDGVDALDLLVGKSGGDAGIKAARAEVARLRAVEVAARALIVEGPTVQPFVETFVAVPRSLLNALDLALLDAALATRPDAGKE